MVKRFGGPQQVLHLGDLRAEGLDLGRRCAVTAATGSREMSSMRRACFKAALGMSERLAAPNGAPCHAVGDLTLTVEVR